MQNDTNANTSSDAFRDALSENVDEQELAKFGALANRWWDKNGEFKPLHDLNPLRLQYIDDRAPVQNSTMLDVGCGGGILAEGLAERGATVTGIDMVEPSLAVARLHLLESGLEVEYLQTTAEAFAEDTERQGSFDTVCCLEMLEHVPDPASVIQACSELVRPGGDLFFSTINRNPKSYVFAVLGAEYILNLLPRGTHDYEKFIRPSELASCLRASELTLEDLTGMHYNPLSKRFSLGANVDVNYIVHARKPE